MSSSIKKIGLFITNSFYDIILPDLGDTAGWITGSYYDDSGTITNSSNMRRTNNYLMVTPNTTYSISFTDSSSNRLRIHEYTSELTWIKQGVSTTNKSTTWTTSPTTKYIRIALPINMTDLTITVTNKASVGNTEVIGNTLYEY